MRQLQVPQKQLEQNDICHLQSHATITRQPCYSQRDQDKTAISYHPRCSPMTVQNLQTPTTFRINYLYSVVATAWTKADVMIKMSCRWQWKKTPKFNSLLCRSKPFSIWTESSCNRWSRRWHQWTIFGR